MKRLSIFLVALFGLISCVNGQVLKGHKVTVKDDISSPTFVSGFTGEGWRIGMNGNSADAEFDNVTVRKSLKTYELLIQKIRATNGGIVVSAANAKINNVESSGGSYRVYPDDTDITFVPGDIVRCQTWSGTNAKYYVATVGAVVPNYFTLTVIDGIDIPEPGDEVVQFGHLTDEERQGLIYLTAHDSHSPYIDVLDGVNSPSFNGKTVVRMGKLDGITTPAWGSLHGYGLYGSNIYLQGNLATEDGVSVSSQFGVMEGQISAAVQRVDTALRDIDILLENLDGIEGLDFGYVADSIRVFSERITNQQSQVNQFADQITSKVTLHQVDSIKGLINGEIHDLGSRVTNSESQINQFANKIEHVVSTEYVDSALAVAIFDGVQIGAVNLLENSRERCLTVSAQSSQSTIDGIAESLLFFTPQKDEASSVLYGDNVYMFGGGASRNSVYQYNIPSNQMTNYASMPKALNGLRTVLVGNIVYLLGGEETTGESNRTIYSFNIATKTFSSVGTMHTARQQFGAALYNNAIYSAYGTTRRGSANTTTVIERFDLSSRVSSVYDYVPSEFSEFSGYQGTASKDGIIYFSGGGASDGTRDNLVYYNIAEKKWTGTGYKVASAGPSAGILNDTVYFLSARQPNDVCWYSIKSGTFGEKNAKTMHVAQYSDVIPYNGSLYQYGQSRYVQKYTPISIEGQSLGSSGDNIILYNKLKSDFSYTFSVDSAVSANLTEYEVAIFRPDSVLLTSRKLPISSGRQTFSFRSPVQENGYVVVYAGGRNIDNVGNDLCLHRIQLEEGNVATTWSESTEELTQRVYRAESRITQLADQISLTVKRDEIQGFVDITADRVMLGIRDEINDLVLSGITIDENAIVSRVRDRVNSDISSSISISANRIDIASKSIHLTGNTIASAIQAQTMNVGNGNFTVDTQGNMTANNAMLSGRLMLPFKTINAAGQTLNLDESFSYVIFTGVASNTVRLPSDIKYNGTICFIVHQGVMTSPLSIRDSSDRILYTISEARAVMLIAAPNFSHSSVYWIPMATSL